MVTLGREATAWQEVLRKWTGCFPFNLLQMCFSLSLDQLLASAGDQQKLQAVLSSVGSKSTTFTLIQEAKAQSEVSGHRNGRAAPLGPWGLMLGSVCFPRWRGCTLLRWRCPLQHCSAAFPPHGRVCRGDAEPLCTSVYLRPFQCGHKLGKGSHLLVKGSHCYSLTWALKSC